MRTFFFLSALLINLVVNSQAANGASAMWRHVDIDVSMFSGTRWTNALVLKRLKGVETIFSQCEIALGKISIQSIPPPTGELNLYRDLDMTGPGGLRAAAEALGITSRLSLILIRQFQEGVAGTAGIPSVYETELPEMVNRAWISEEVLEPTYFESRDPSYVPEAHELVHILLDSGHLPVGEFGLMSGEFDHVNGTLTPAECKTLRASRFVAQ